MFLDRVFVCIDHGWNVINSVGPVFFCFLEEKVVSTENSISMSDHISEFSSPRCAVPSETVHYCIVKIIHNSFDRCPDDRQLQRVKQ